jgi:putative tryptophan/tyrosine transport system substrate-binding protein
MKRREFIAGAGISIVMQGAVLAQASRKIGYLQVQSTTMSPPPITLSSTRPLLQSLGYSEGELILRGADGDPKRLPELATELISLNVGVLITVGPAALRAASQATKTTPIVAVDLETDPVRAGLAATFARPGGNVTGLFLDQPALAGKWLELLREAVPSIERVALVWEPTTGSDQLEAAKVAARRIGIDALVLEVRAIEEYGQAFGSLGGGQRTGIVQLGSPVLTLPPTGLGDAALKHQFPTISFYSPHARAGALLSYGPNLEVYFPRAAVLADKIINGGKPAELPIEQPDHFQLIINLKTARALGIAIPPSLLARADEVIE